MKVQLDVIYKWITVIVGLGILCLIAVEDAVASTPGPCIKTTTDTSSIMIGGRITLTVEIIYPNGSNVEWPQIEDSLDTFEVLHQEVIFTTIEEKWKKQKLKITLTNFTPGNHTIHALPVIVYTPWNTFAFQTRQISVICNMPSVDITHPFKDIHPSADIAYTQAELLPYKLGISLLLILIIVAFITHHREVLLSRSVIGRGPRFYDQTITNLKKLEKAKDISTELPAVLRTYISNRFEVPSRTATTKEIINLLQTKSLQEEALIKITNILTLTDRAKFAKDKKQADDAQILLKESREFVHATKP